MSLKTYTHARSNLSISSYLLMSKYCFQHIILSIIEKQWNSFFFFTPDFSLNWGDDLIKIPHAYARNVWCDMFQTDTQYVCKLFLWNQLLWSFLFHSCLSKSISCSILLATGLHPIDYAVRFMIIQAFVMLFKNVFHEKLYFLLQTHLDNSLNDSLNL